jgi:signal transduction histidine kinase
MQTDQTPEPAAETPAPYESLATRALVDRLSHHVRSPLAGISGALHILRDRLVLDGQEKMIVSEILRRLQQLNRSMENLVDLSRPLAPRWSAVSVRQLVRVCADRIETGDLRLFEIDIEPDADELSADAALIRRALHHLLANAVEAGGTEPVTVRARAVDDWCRLEVIDCGAGWAREARLRMFEPFVTSKSQHLGVGLAVARRIARAHRGRLDCERADATGTTMVLWLPVDSSATEGART